MDEAFQRNPKLVSLRSVYERSKAETARLLRLREFRPANPRTTVEAIEAARRHCHIIDNYIEALKSLKSLD